MIRSLHRPLPRCLRLRLGLRLGLASFATLFGLHAAHATGTFPNELAQGDQQRLQAFETARKSAIDAARQRGSAQDVTELNRILEGTPVQPDKLTGEWRCRTVKLDGIVPLVIYQRFRCRITEDTGGLRLEKLTGSQRTSGTFYDVGQARLGYAGATALGSEKGLRYGQDPARNDVGYLVQLSPDRLRLEIPLPAAESRFDILELTR